MDKSELLRATLESGVEPIEIKLVPVRNTLTRGVMAYRTVAQLNTQSLGVLLPDQYGPVASRNALCVKLALSNIAEISEIIEYASENGIKAEWFSAACPVRMITKGSAAELLGGLFEDIGFSDPTRLCLEFPSQVLFEDREKAAAELNALRFMGIKTAICDFGDEFCPVGRLSGFPFDYAILDRSVTLRLAQEETTRSSAALIAFVRGCGIEVIAEGAADSNLISELYRADCGGYIPEPDNLLSWQKALSGRGGYR
ncbi:MAG: EAL domain-containing protein [Clostridiales bacterium]|nr:EAL domain-containing protein [Clostridiales bacterium]